LREGEDDRQDADAIDVHSVSLRNAIENAQHGDEWDSFIARASSRAKYHDNSLSRDKTNFAPANMSYISAQRREQDLIRRVFFGVAAQRCRRVQARPPMRSPCVIVLVWFLLWKEEVLEVYNCIASEKNFKKYPELTKLVFSVFDRLSSGAS